MIRYKQITTLVIFAMINLSVINSVFSMEKILSVDEMDMNEMEAMLQDLKRERAELDKLKSEFKGTVKTKTDMLEEEMEKDVETKNKVVLTNFTKKSIAKKKKFIEKQRVFPDEKKDDDFREIITLESESEGVEESEKLEVSDGNEIIHPFEIAENLYKLGEYQTALDIYQLIIKNEIVKDKKIWISYQIANCYRKLGSFNKAVEAYREMQEVYEGTYWAKQSQWYIQDLEWRAKVEEKLEKVIER